MSLAFAEELFQQPVLPESLGKPDPVRLEGPKIQDW